MPHSTVAPSSINSAFCTEGQIKIDKKVSVIPVKTALDEINEKIDTHQGALFVSNYEIPERYARWDIGFVCPALELIARKRNFEINALNENGVLLLDLMRETIEAHPHVADCECSESSLKGCVLPMPAFFSEEARSKQPSVFSVIRALCKLFRSDEKHLGLYGAFGYDLVFQFENIDPKHERDPEQADCHLFFPTELVVVDHQKDHAEKIQYFIHTPKGITSSNNTGRSYTQASGIADGVIHCDHDPGEFENKVERVQEHCRKGDFFEIVLSQSFSTGFNEKPSELFQRICKQNPSPYSFLINTGTEQLVGASPEMYIRVKGRRFETCPISGTVPIGKDAMETAEHIKRLISSEKEESELTMCTDVDRNDMSRICVPGSVKLLERRIIEKYSRLVHTVDHLEGELAEGFDTIDAILTHMWAATVTGSPKPIAMQTIENMENTPRKWYSGCIGVLCFNGFASTGMTLRTVHLKNGLATVRSGATLLFDSDPVTEEKETQIKASAFLEAALGSKQKPKAPALNLPKSGQGKKVFFVDNQDSFVHTLASYVRQTGAEVTTYRTGFPMEVLDEEKPDLIFISPGPKTPKDLNVLDVVAAAVERNIPLFGVCLGHQGIAEYFGGTLSTFETPVHGKPSLVYHTGNTGNPLFVNLPQPFTAGRYHSLYVDRETLPECLEITAETEDGVIMGLQHKTLPIASIQFHPESILTLKSDAGIRMIHQVLKMLCAG